MMKAVANTLIGHAVVLAVAGVYTALFFIGHTWCLGWVHNTDWRWIVSVFFPLVVGVGIPLWFAAMHGLGRAIRADY